MQNTSSLHTYIGYGIAILSILYSYYLYKKGQEKKVPQCYFSTRKNIVKLDDKSENKIKLFYNDNEVTRVFTTRVWLWNNGKKPINCSDIPAQSKLLLILSDDNFSPKILDFEILKISRPEINFNLCKNSDRSLELNFDFLDHLDGVVIEIQHTGSKDTEIFFEGIILGATKGVNIIKPQEKNKLILNTGNLVRNIGQFPFKSKFNFYLFFSSYFLALSSIIVVAIFQLIKPDKSSIVTTTAQLTNVLKTEFPNISDVTLYEINEKIQLIRPDSPIAIIVLIFTIIFIGYILFLFIQIFLLENLTYYPKTLNLINEEKKDLNY